MQIDPDRTAQGHQEFPRVTAGTSSLATDGLALTQPLYQYHGARLGLRKETKAAGAA